MVGELNIKISDNVKRTQYYLEKRSREYYDNDYLIEIKIPSNVKIDLTKLKLGVAKFIKRKLTSKQYAMCYPDRMEIINDAISRDIDLFDSCDSISIDDKDKHVIDIFEANTEYKVKKIYISDRTFSVTRKSLEEAKECYRERSNVYLKVEGNKEYVSFDDYKKTVEIISSVVEKIKSYNMSPLEEIMYAFDYARDRIYVPETEEEKYTKSRDLTSVLLGDKIVCVGYAEIFDKILKGLGYLSSVYIIDFGKPKHAINIAYIKDDKYGVEGIYYFDPTANRKKNNSNEYLNNYSCFARTRQNFQYMFNFSDKTFGDFWLMDYFDALNEYEKIECFSKREMRTALMNINNFFKGEQLRERYGSIHGSTPSKQELTDTLERYKGLYYQPIDLEKMFNVLLQVRKIEYYENPKKYELSFQDLLAVVEKSRWSHENLFYNWNEEEEFKEKVSSNSEDYEKEMKLVKLTKVLSNIKK